MPLQARTEFAAAINQLASEKGVDTDVILNAIRSAALAAYRKDLSYRNEAIPDDFEELDARLDPASGEISIYRGEENITPPGFARIAAQTAKQVITQKLHEAEKGAIMEEYEQKVGSIVSGSIQRQEGNTFFVDLGRAEGIMPPSEQVKDDYYAPNQRMKFYIKEIRESGRGPEVVVSRADAKLIEGLFRAEVPEMQSEAVEIKVIAREAGGRAKIAVVSSQDGVDPVGSLVGQKGVRVQAVINELGEEKIDIIPYSEDPARFIAAALSPAKDIIVRLNEEEKVAKVTIPESQLSLAIGKGGQNVRLAAKLTGWKIDIEGSGESSSAEASEDKEQKDVEAKETVGEGEVVSDTSSSAQPDDTTGQTEPEVADIEKIEENIDEATREESGAAQEEEPEEELAKAVADAEADMADDEKSNPEEELGSMGETEDTQRGDLVGDKEPSEEEEAPVETTDNNGESEEKES